MTHYAYMHYAYNDVGTACGRRFFYNHKADPTPRTNVEAKVNCGPCRDWLREYREAFPPGHSQPCYDDRRIRAPFKAE